MIQGRKSVSGTGTPLADAGLQTTDKRRVSLGQSRTPLQVLNSNYDRRHTMSATNDGVAHEPVEINRRDSSSYFAGMDDDVETENFTQHNRFSLMMPLEDLPEESSVLSQNTTVNDSTQEQGQGRELEELATHLAANHNLALNNSGHLSLDEPVYKYYIDPDIINDPNTEKLTTRIILSHRTGFINNRDSYENGILKFEFEPGTQYQYSGEGYDYLRKVIEHKFKTTIEKLADSLIFKPLKMKDTKFYWNNNIDELRFAKWHTEKGEVYQDKKHTTASGADDLLTTIEDYSKFMVYIMNGADLSTELQQEMVKNQYDIRSKGSYEEMKERILRFNDNFNIKINRRLELTE